MKKTLLFCMIVLFAPLAVDAQDYPKAEIFTGYSCLRGQYLDANFSEFKLSATGNFNSWFGATADLSCHYVHGYEVYSFLFGPKITFRNSDRSYNSHNGRLSTGLVWRFGGK